MSTETISLNETMQIHELLNLKTICMTTSKMMEGVVFDQELKQLLEKDVQGSIEDIKQLKLLLQKAPKIKM